MRFESQGEVSFPDGKNLRLQAPAAAPAFARTTECRDLLQHGSKVRYEKVPKATTNIGRLVVQRLKGKLIEYCVFVFNTDF